MARPFLTIVNRGRTEVMKMSSVINVPRFSVKLRNMKESVEVRVPNGVQVQWELERATKKYPTSEEAPTVWATWCAWKAGTRSGVIDAVMPYEAFIDELEVISFDDSEEVDPTKKAPGDG